MANSYTITDDMLQNALDNIYCPDVPVKNSKQEVEFALSIHRAFLAALNRRGIEADLSSEMVKVGSVNHPIIYAKHPDYGVIGILINKNYLVVLRIKLGKTSQLIYDKECLINEANANEAMRSRTQTDGCCGCATWLMHDHYANKAIKEAEEIEYDPTELAHEARWEKDILNCLNNIND